ncbi:hypothetical protein EXN66_Car007136 [Channa argus]|uniref:Uncharacterized protein n=1 Tax=Channa argus TaxID=215402 RepID=A0A6G1PMA3_CHAAH|nr:hypothetical protein EXN66_Car007136 [Channa argus]
MDRSSEFLLCVNHTDEHLDSFPVVTHAHICVCDFVRTNICCRPHIACWNQAELRPRSWYDCGLTIADNHGCLVVLLGSRPEQG